MRIVLFRSSPDLAARTCALVIVALVVGLGIRYNTFAAWATDSGAYISAGMRWAKADVFSPGFFAFWPPWAADRLIGTPHGLVPGPTPGTITGQYPLGYPLLIAAAIRIGGPLAAHVVAPLTAGLLAWCAFVLARTLSTPWAGLIAAFLIAATPVTLFHIVMPFSDVPAAAFWALAWVMSVRPGHGAAAAAGAAVAFAVMIRPNLAPLALVIATTLAAGERLGLGHSLKRVVVFGLAAAIGPLIVVWSQAVLYGHPLQSGYKVPLDYFFQLERVPVNAQLYPRLLLELHTWVAFAGLLVVPYAVMRKRLGALHQRQALVALSAAGLVAVNYALYLPYLTFEGWYWLRFMLPALLALFVLLAGAVDHLRVWVSQRWARMSVLAVIPALVVAWTPREHLRAPIYFDRIQMMEHYLREALPANAVILTTVHGAALAAATGRPIVRMDLVSHLSLDLVVDDLKRRGLRPVYVLDTAIEGDTLDRFKTSKFSRLTWPARAEISSGQTVLYYDLNDREAFLSGDRWPTDVLLAWPSRGATIQWADFRTSLERVLLPVPEETAMFRSALEAVYKKDLGRSAVSASIEPGAALKWTRRYLRYRLHGCDHEVATKNIFDQLRGAEPPPLCARPEALSFPPRNETLDFRRRLETKLRADAHRTVTTSVDLEGETVWTQEYLQLRVKNCSHDEATIAVLNEITGRPERPPCAVP